MTIKWSIKKSQTKVKNVIDLKIAYVDKVKLLK